MYIQKIFYFLIGIASILIIGCRSNTNENFTSESNTSVERYIIDLTDTCQTIDNFGASDAWSIYYIGQWPEKKQEQIATWLFSTENDVLGNPKGIGLSLWRFNIGAGSKEQGDSSMIHDARRRAECFLLPDGKYDWNKQKGQRKFMQLAKNQGVEFFLGYVYSPPVYWTVNGLATNLNRDGTFNLTKSKIDDYADYIADIVEGINKNEGVYFNYICPFNEPDGHWNWNGNGQEGTAATKYEVAKITKLIDKEFTKRKINTKILVPESADYYCMFKTHELSDTDHGYQIQSYFTPDSTDTYLGNLKHVPRLISGHSYWTNTPLDRLRDIRNELGDVLKKNHVGFWQTELCVMSNDEEIGGGHGKDLSMRTALYIARVIHHDLVYANASAWHWWRAVATTDYKDGLVYAVPDKQGTDGTFSDSKLMWVLGNYSRFIRPGAKRIGIVAMDKLGNKITEGDTDPQAIMISAYKNSNNSLTVVVINYSTEDKNIILDLKGSLSIDWQPYITSDSSGFNLKKQPKIPNGKPIRVLARSVVTLHGLSRN